MLKFHKGFELFLLSEDMGFDLIVLSEDVVSLPLDGLTHFLPCAGVSTRVIGQ